MFDTRIKTHHAGLRKTKKHQKPLSKEELEDFLQTTPTHKEGVIYFHVPYCDNICSFCSMNRSKLDGELDNYANFLLQKIDYFSKQPYIKQKKFESVYFGGGTPTIFKKTQLEKIIKAINKSFNLDKSCEFSFESTLHNLNEDKIKLMQDLGVNRYSIGIQTFSDEGRKLLNRVGSKDKTIKKLSKIREAFKGNMCIDIIYNYPNQTKDEAKQDAQISKDLGVDSVSFYSLMFHDGSDLSQKVSLKDYYVLEHDKALHDIFLETMLKDDNYEILEYTKINKKNRDKYKYIRLSHKGVDILPIGVGAGGRLGKYSSFSPTMHMQMFLNTQEEELKLKLLGSLFQYPRIKYKEIKKLTSQTIYEQIYTFLQEVERFGYIRLEDETIEFEKSGIFWGNTIASKILDIALKDYE